MGNLKESVVIGLSSYSTNVPVALAESSVSEPQNGYQSAGAPKLDASVLIGLVLTVGIVVGAFALLGLPFRMLVQPEALLIVVGGTATALIMNFSNRTWSLLKDGIRHSLTQPSGSPEEAVALLTEVAQFVRKNGLLALQPLMDDIPSAFVRKGVQLMQDNRPPVLIQHALTTDMEVQYRQELDAARLFEAAGGFAPTLGIVGAVIGLMHVASAFDSPNQLTHGIASAFTATLYGVGLANLVCLPLAGRLKQQARDAWFQKTILTEGLMSIYAGDHPLVTEEKLRAFLNEIPTIPQGSLQQGQLSASAISHSGLRFGAQAKQAEPLSRKNLTQSFKSMAGNDSTTTRRRGDSFVSQDLAPPVGRALPSSVFEEPTSRIPFSQEEPPLVPAQRLVTRESAKPGLNKSAKLGGSRPQPNTLGGRSSAANRLNASGRFGDAAMSAPRGEAPLSSGSMVRGRTERYPISSAELEELAANDGWIE